MLNLAICLTVNGKPCKVFIHKEALMFEQVEKSKKNSSCLILNSDMLSSEILDSAPEETTIRVHHVVPINNNRLRVKTCDISGDTDACFTLKEHIDGALNDLNRPSRLLVFVNPKSGHQKALKIYNAKVAPLFKLCGIHTEVIVTEGPGQPRELLSNCDLRLIHGIVAVGGDGMYSECVNGLLERLQADAHINMHDPQAQIRASKISIGIIPAGSGNYLVKYIHGTHDIETATIKIILGDHLFTNVVSVHQGRKLQCYSSLLLEFGLIGEIMHDCEKHRWMGPNRYNIVPITTLLKRKPVDVSIDYLPSDNTKRTAKFLRQTSLPASQLISRLLPGEFSPKRFNRLNSSPDNQKPEGWKKMEDSVYGVDTYVVTQKSKDDRLVPFFGDNALSMWITTDKCSFKKHVEHLSKFKKGDPSCWEYEFIRRVRTRGYRVKLTSAPVKTDENGERKLLKKYYFNADGEAILLETPEFEIRLHENVIPIFGKIS